MDFVFILLSLGTLVLMAVSAPLAMQRVKPNRFYGVRTALTLRDERAWYRANRTFGIAMLYAGVVFFLLSAIVGNWRADADNHTTSIALFLVEVSVPALMVLCRRSAKE